MAGIKRLNGFDPCTRRRTQCGRQWRRGESPRRSASASLFGLPQPCDLFKPPDVIGRASLHRRGDPVRRCGGGRSCHACNAASAMSQSTSP